MSGDSLAFEDGSALLVEHGEILFILADTRTENGCADECRNAADEVYGAGAREVVEAELREPAASPDPMSRDGVNDKGDDEAVNAVSEKIRSLCHSARDDGRGGRAEYEVEHHLEHIARRELRVDDGEIGHVAYHAAEV